MTQAIHYRRYPRCTTHIVDSDIFIVTRSTIQHLNTTAATIWLALEEPATRRELFDILWHVFPAVERRRLAADLDGFLRIHTTTGLIVQDRPRASKATGVRMAVKRKH